ncbi:uncharacterized protein LOC135489052 isoform X1 [Lineus longissimus]|uniref:uncharacterized protein LOC135489052 isoform X1 n=1 Tax=Lineus longissimus TaxID=88925 RepID=UPI00315C69D5
MENFRMRRETFDFLCRTLQPYIEKRDTNMRKSISVDRKVGAVIWVLATQCELRTICHLFAMSQGSLCMFVRQTCKAINDSLAPRLIKLPTAEETTQIIDGFERRWGFPNSAGAIDGTHIPILAPKSFKCDYYNRKAYHSYNVQAYVDDRYHFRDVVAGWPGSVHDARVLGNSDLYDLGQSGRLFAGVTKNVSGTDLPPVILGDPAYPLLPWLMKPYPVNAQTTAEQKRFNYMQSRNRMVVENSFGFLKGRWRRLLKRNDFRDIAVPNIILACWTLHNLCEDQGEDFPDHWHGEVRERIEELRVPQVPNREQDNDRYAHRIRNTLAEHLTLLPQ